MSRIHCCRSDERPNAWSAGRHRDPFAVLGLHRRSGRASRASVGARAVHPRARTVEVVDQASGEATPMARVHDDGVFEVHLVGPSMAAFDYRLRVTGHDGHVAVVDDPYRYGSVFGELDGHLWREGTHQRAYEAFGARPIRHGDADGVQFAVWAPNAQRVSVVGDFNGWDPRVHPMRLLADAGVWEIFIPGLGPGPRYKFDLLDARGRHVLKADPFARLVRGAARHRLDRLARRLRLGRRRVDGRAATPRRRSAPPRCRSTRCTSDRGAAPTTAGGR